MKSRIKIILIMALITVTSTAFSANEFTIKDITELRDIATPLKGADPTIPDDSDLTALDKVIGEAKVVGLGEGTHGTHEFFQMKHRILQYLVQKKGFTIFAIEGSMPHAYRLNDYIVNGNGDPKKLIMGMQFWTWDTKEVLAMVEWMREYNKKSDKKIKFTGFDMQLKPSSYKDDITNRLDKAGKENKSQEIIQIISDITPVDQKAQEYYAVELKRDSQEVNAEKNYLQLLDALKAKHLPDDEYKKQAAVLELDYKNELSKIDDEFEHVARSIKDEINALITPINARIDKLVSEIISDKILFVSKLGSEEYEQLLENIEIIKEYLQRQSVFDTFDTRDQLMAKNVLWILQQNPTAKLILWAHNGHIGHSDKYPTMGKYLQNNLAENYRSIGFLTSEGRYTAMADDAPKLEAFDLQTPPTEAMEFIIDSLGISTVLLNFSNHENLPEFLRNPTLSRCLWGIGAMEIPKEFQFNPPPGESFSDYIAFNYDGLIYIKTTTSSQLFQMNIPSLEQNQRLFNKEFHNTTLILDKTIL